MPQSALMSTLTLKQNVAAGSTTRRMLNKVPEVTVYFWVIKVLCTTVGETASDYLSENLGLGLTTTTFITGALLASTLVFQFRANATSRGSTGSPSCSSASSARRSPTT